MFEVKELFDKKIIFLFLTVYPITIGYAYVIGYWYSGFNINIFPYLNISDIVAYSIPSFLIIILLTISSSFYYFYFKRRSPVDSDKGASRLKNNLRVYFMFLALIGASIILTYFLHKKTKVSIFPILLVDSAMLTGIITSFILYLLTRQPVILTELTRTQIKYIAFIVFSPILISYLFGFSSSLFILHTQDYHYILVNDINNQGPTKDGELKYLGKVGGYFFVLSKDNETYQVLKFENFKKLKIYRHKYQPIPKKSFLKH